jgi:hypothetical protein
LFKEVAGFVLRGKQRFHLPAHRIIPGARALQELAAFVGCPRSNLGKLLFRLSLAVSSLVQHHRSTWYAQSALR